MSSTFLETLAQRDLIAEQTQEIMLQREQATLESLQVQEAMRNALEHDPWDSADPFQAGNRAGLGGSSNSLLFPGAMYTHTARLGSRRNGDYPPYFRTEMQHWQIVDAARVVEAFCPTARGVLEILVQWVIFTGFTYIVRPRREGVNPALVKAAQAVLDRWMRQVDWYAYEVELFMRCVRDGEVFVVMETDPITGLLGLRIVEPEQVKEPRDSQALKRKLGVSDRNSWKYGILTPRENTSLPVGYWVVSQYSDTQNRGKFYHHHEMFHLKSFGIDRQSKRGVSDFFSVANDFVDVQKLLRGLREGATVQAMIAWIRQHPPGMTPTLLGSNADPTNVNRQGDRTTAVHLDGPTVLDTSAGMTYEPGPLARAGRSDVLIKVLQAALRGIGTRWQFPEGVISGDNSNQNLSSAVTAEGPFVRALQTRQWYYRSGYKRLTERVLDHAAVTGQLGPARENIMDEIEIGIEMPPVLARKLGEETQRSAVMAEAGVMSRRTWAAREDLDHDQEQQEIAEDTESPMGAVDGEGRKVPIGIPEIKGDAK